MRRWIWRAARHAAFVAAGVVVLGATASACGAPHQSGPGAHSRGVRVELRAYSGRDNPSWELTDGEVQELARRMAQLHDHEGPGPAEPGLGEYGGFMITNGGGAAGLPRSITVFNGVAVEGPGVQHHLDDVGLEDWMLDMARRHGLGDLLIALGR